MNWWPWVFLGFLIYLTIGLALGIYIEYEIRREKVNGSVFDVMREESRILFIMLTMLVGPIAATGAFISYLSECIKPKKK